MQLLLERRALRTGAALLGDLRGRRVLDVGAGTGALAQELARRGAGELILLDRLPEPLRRARRRVPGARLVLGDATATRLAAASFDVVAMGYLLHLLPDATRALALREARRVLRPGGVLLVVSHLRRGDRGSAWPLGAGAAVTGAIQANGLRVRERRLVRGGYRSEVVVADPV